MKKFFTTLFAVSAIAVAHAQTAPNWTASDCKSNSHTLYTELDNSKVIVMVWVMPCPSCLAPAKTAYTEVQKFASSHPGQVLYYMVDDYGDGNCTALSDWASSNSIGDTSKMTFFGNAGNTIDMTGLGSTGMPKVAVIGGGTNHTVFFNKNNAAANDATGINAAIVSAIAATNVSNLENNIAFSVSPNPATDRVTIQYNKPVKQITITAMNGQVVKELNFGTGKINPIVETTQLANGVYMVKVTDINDETGVQKIVKQ